MLPKRKYISSYKGMGVAVLTRGQRSAIKLKISNILADYGPCGPCVIGLHLDDMHKHKDRLWCGGDFFKVENLEYIHPRHVFKNCREALEWKDGARIKELWDRLDGIRSEMETNEKRRAYLNGCLAETKEKIDEITAVQNNRPWNRKKICLKA